MDIGNGHQYYLYLLLTKPKCNETEPPVQNTVGVVFKCIYIIFLVQKAADDNELRSVMEEESIDLLIRSGYTKPVFKVSTTNIVDIVQTVVL